MEGREVLEVSRSLRIPLSEITIRATTSSGPGGQHANRSQTRIDVRFDVAGSASLGPRQRARLLERLGPVVQAVAGDERSQARNRQLALDRLAAKLADALKVDAPRRATRPTLGSVTRRLDSKRRQSQRKQQRRPTHDD
ncbi:MAG: aminoacyl-tRNA hydrolase [Actinobacteria bacterium]|nr:aminoacyl-tRNA hydrolase [Actinomycetota bacterium]